MALTDSEIMEAKFHTGWSVLEAGAEPYIGIASAFDTVIQAYTEAGASTTSSTAVTAASTATPATLTLASATGFALFDRVVIDVDDRQEEATVQSVSGSDIVVLLTKAHSGTYPVTVEGGEVIIRRILRKLRDLTGVSGSMASGTSAASGGLKKVDEVEWYDASSASGKTQFDMLAEQVMYWRDQLASALGIPNGWRHRAGSGLSVTLY